MRIATPADAIYTLIARLPLYAIAALVIWAGYLGLEQVELRSHGTNYIAPHAESIPPNAIVAERMQVEEDLLSAYSSGDTAKMQAALSRAEAAGLAG